MRCGVPRPLRSAGTRSRGPTVPAPSFSRFPQTTSHRSKREPGSVVLRAPHTAAGLGRAGAHHAGLQGWTTGRAVGARAPGPPFPLRRVGAGRGSTGHLGAECSVCAHIYMSVDSLTMHAPTHAHTCINTRAHNVHAHTHMCAHGHTYIYTCIQKHMHTHVHTSTQTCTHVRTCTHTCPCTGTRMWEEFGSATSPAWVTSPGPHCPRGPFFILSAYKVSATSWSALEGCSP